MIKKFFGFVDIESFELSSKFVILKKLLESFKFHGDKALIFTRSIPSLGTLTLFITITILYLCIHCFLVILVYYYYLRLIHKVNQLYNNIFK